MRNMRTENETAVAANSPTESPSSDSENNAANAPSKKTKKTRRKPKKLSTEENLIARFANCGRCSFFLTAYRLSRDPAGFATAVSEINHKWLTLTWDTPMRKLVSHSYGVRFDIDAYFVEGCCPDCLRAYVCKLDDHDQQPPYFRIKI